MERARLKQRWTQRASARVNAAAPASAASTRRGTRTARPRCAPSTASAACAFASSASHRRAGSSRRRAAPARAPSPLTSTACDACARARAGSCDMTRAAVGRRQRVADPSGARRTPRISTAPAARSWRAAITRPFAATSTTPWPGTRMNAAGVYSVTVTRSVPGKSAVHRRVRDPRQPLDAARDRAGVDEDQRVVRVHAGRGRGPRRRPRGSRPRLRCDRRRGAASSHRGTRARPRPQSSRRRAARAAGAVRPRGRPSMRRSRMPRVDRAGAAPSVMFADLPVIAVEADELELGARGRRRSPPRPAGGPRSISARDVARPRRRARRRRSWRASATRPRRRRAGPSARTRRSAARPSRRAGS